MKIRSGSTGPLPAKDNFSMFSRRYKKYVYLHWMPNLHTRNADWAVLLFDQHPSEVELQNVTMNIQGNNVDSWQQISFKEITEIYLEVAPAASFRIYRWNWIFSSYCLI